MTQKTNLWLTVACILLAAGIFAFDTLLLPLGVAGGVPYVAVVLISLWFPRGQDVLYIAIAVSALTILGYFWSEPAGTLWMVLANPGLALFAIWVTAAVGYQRKWSEKVLYESEQRMRAVLNTAIDAIITIDQRGIITSVNPATQRMFGYTQEELVGKNVNMLMPAPYRDEHDGYIARYLETGETRIFGIGREVVGRYKDGTVFPIDLTVSEVDQLGLFTGVIRDISERKELQKQVLEIAAEEDRRIGHELHDHTQQQLTGLGLLARNVAKSLDKLGGQSKEIGVDLKEKAWEVCEGLEETARHVSLLARGLIPVEVDAHGLRSALTELVDRLDQSSEVSFRFTCDEEVEVVDNFTATHLYRIAQEAINNAIKHSQADRIEISLQQLDDGTMLSVSDNGIGIPDRRPRGPGMGVRVMAYRAKLIGASFNVTHADGGGTKAVCTLRI